MSVDVPGHVLAQALGRLFARLVGLGVAQRRDGFEREFRVDHQRALVAGQKHHAVRPRAVRQRELEFVGALRQPVLDDRLHARLAEGAARLLVGEHLAQRGDLGGEVGEILLRGVDDREPLVELVQALHGLLGGGRHRLVEPAGDRGEAFRNHARKLGLPAAQGLAHRAQAADRLRLDAGEAREALLDLLSAVGLGGGLADAFARGAAGRHGEPEQNAERQHGERRSATAPTLTAVPPTDEKRFAHGVGSTLIRRRKRTKREHGFPGRSQRRDKHASH